MAAMVLAPIGRNLAGFESRPLALNVQPQPREGVYGDACGYLDAVVCYKPGLRLHTLEFDA